MQLLNITRICWLKKPSKSNKKLQRKEGRQKNTLYIKLQKLFVFFYLNQFVSKSSAKKIKTLTPCICIFAIFLLLLLWKSKLLKFSHLVLTKQFLSSVVWMDFLLQSLSWWLSSYFTKSPCILKKLHSHFDGIIEMLV